MNSQTAKALKLCQGGWCLAMYIRIQHIAGLHSVTSLNDPGSVHELDLPDLLPPRGGADRSGAKAAELVERNQLKTPC
jgi:hypothetical protein